MAVVLSAMMTEEGPRMNMNNAARIPTADVSSAFVSRLCKSHRETLHRGNVTRHSSKSTSLRSMSTVPQCPRRLASSAVCKAFVADKLSVKYLARHQVYNGNIAVAQAPLIGRDLAFCGGGSFKKTSEAYQKDDKPGAIKSSPWLSCVWCSEHGTVQ